ncbi:hypothetical protein GCM10009837_55040 [Streptomyces durmitorensis]
MGAELGGAHDAPLDVGEVTEGAGGERGVVVHDRAIPAADPPPNRCYTPVDITGQPRTKVQTFDCRKGPFVRGTFRGGRHAEAAEQRSAGTPPRFA